LFGVARYNMPLNTSGVALMFAVRTAPGAGSGPLPPMMAPCSEVLSRLVHASDRLFTLFLLI
jgi:hypothetical protein